MRFTSDDQRKAMFARLGGGGVGRVGYRSPSNPGIIWILPPSTPGTAQNTNHRNPIPPSSYTRPGNYGLPVIGTVGYSGGAGMPNGFDRGIGIANPLWVFQDLTWNAGVAGLDDWANTDLGDIFDFNHGNATEVNWALPELESNASYYNQVASNYLRRTGIQAPPYESSNFGGEPGGAGQYRPGYQGNGNGSEAPTLINP